MKFESLANELLLDIFDFLNGIHLLRAFYNLNTRFNQLLFSSFQIYYIDFRSISKHDFNIVCHQHLPLIINRIISLHLSNNDETSNLTELFLFHNFKLNQFNYLQSLSLYYIYSLDILNQIILQCQNLPNLKHLKIIKCYRSLRNKTDILVNNIWNLKKLTYCNLCYIHSYGMSTVEITVSTITSLTITHLYLENINLNLQNLSNLCQYTPNLQRLSTSIKCNQENEQLHNNILSILSLNISFSGSKYSMISLFQHIPNLSYLTFDTSSIYLNGYEWKKIICNYLFKIKIFRLRMIFKFHNSNNKKKQMENLLNTFRTSFWFIEHQWFFRCEWFPLGTHGYLYTLPYAFNKFDYDNKRLFLTTCINEEVYWLYNHIRILRYNFLKNSTYQNLIPCHIRFSNVYHLQIQFPFDKNFFSIISSLTQLTSLDVTIVEEYTIYSQLQLLLNQLSNLYSLDINVRPSFFKALVKIKIPSLRRLHFKEGFLPDEIIFFSKEQCDIFSRSTLAHQCEVLLISIDNRIDIINLIKKLSNLRALIVRCNDDEWKDMDLLSINDEFIEWLQNCLPKTYSINRDTEETSNIRFWIN